MAYRPAVLSGSLGESKARLLPSRNLLSSKKTNGDDSPALRNKETHTPQVGVSERFHRRWEFPQNPQRRQVYCDGDINAGQRSSLQPWLISVFMHPFPSIIHFYPMVICLYVASPVAQR